MNIFTMLKNDHKELLAVMDKMLVSSNQETKKFDESFQKFKAEFMLHDKIEDEILYPKLLEIPELKQLILKSYQAHHVVEVAILELRITPYSNENWLPKFSVVYDCIKHHIEEEESVVFPEAEKLLDKNEMDNLTAMAKEYKDKNKS